MSVRKWKRNTCNKILTKTSLNTQCITHCKQTFVGKYVFAYVKFWKERAIERWDTSTQEPWKRLVGQWQSLFYTYLMPKIPHLLWYKLERESDNILSAYLIFVILCTTPQRESILGVVGVLVGVLAVLVGVLDVFGIGRCICYILYLGSTYLVFSSQKNSGYCLYKLWIIF